MQHDLLHLLPYILIKHEHAQTTLCLFHGTLHVLCVLHTE